MGVDIGFDSQTPSLPSGGGSVAGIGETFTPDLSMGTGSFTIRLDCPNGPNDIGPRLTLRYDTASPNGPFGMGFGLPLPRLLRSTARGFPRYDANDTLMLEGAGELVALGAGAYRPQVDGGVWRVRASGDGYRLTDREGLHYFLGTTAAGRLIDARPGLPGLAKIYAWHLERIEDALGNAVHFTWQRDQNQLYLSTLRYGAYEVRFDYEARSDVLRWGRCGFPILTALRCKAIELHLPSEPQSLLRRWTLTYTQSAANGCSLLSEVTLSGFNEAASRVDAPPLRLGYSTLRPRALMRFRNTDDGAAPAPLNQPGRRVELLDWNGDGLPDLLQISEGGRARLWPNVGDCTWGRPRSVGEIPFLTSATAAVAFADMNGDGVADVIRFDRLMDGYVPREPRAGFERPVAWAQAPSVPAGAARARLVDLDGDGVVDLLSSSSAGLTLHYRVDPGGWTSPPQVVPRGDVADVNLADPHVFLADMTGDGSMDLVRVDAGGVTYSPYLGMGRWDDPVAMQNPPELPFDVRPERLFLNDIDGDGCADLIYLDAGRVVYWMNQTGNRFSEPRVIGYVPTGQISEVRVADMRGSGTAGLLWSTSGPFQRGVFYYYLDFSGDAKPALLTTIDNGLGLTTTIGYTTSAQEAAADARQEQPWVTFLPMPVTVVARIAATDRATGRTSVKVYRYHDGRYDGVLREFAGFGRVDEDQLGDETVPTLRTTTWFHIGVDPERAEERHTFEERARWRSIRGRIYRQERYGLDGSSEQNFPYDRLEQQWTALTAQTVGGLVVIPRLLAKSQATFERVPAPAAVITTTNLAWDADNNVLESVETAAIAGDPSQTPTLRTLAAFAVDAAGRFHSRAWRVRQFDSTGATVADTVTVFDDAPEGTVGAQGVVTKRSALVLGDALVAQVYGADVPDFAALGYRRRPNESGWWIDQARYHRIEDATGLHGSVIGPLGAKTTFDFDANKTYPVRITDPRGNTMRAEYDYRTCRIVRLIDAAGANHDAVYDALARPQSTIEPLDNATFPTTSHEYTASQEAVHVTTRRRAVSGLPSTIDNRELFDGTDLLLERRARDEAGEIIVNSFVYNTRGLTARAHLERRAITTAYALPDASLPHTSFGYDALGRLVHIRHPDGSVRSVTYGPLVVEESDEEDTRPGSLHAGTSTRTMLDVTGKVRAIDENLGGRQLRSTYAYDLKGNLILHTDAAGNAVRMMYDLLGRCLRIDRPEQSSVTVLDASGNAVEARGGDGRRVLHQFDACDRMVAVRYDTPGSAPVARVTYHDAVGPPPPEAGVHTNGGRCVRIEDEGGTTIFDYDERGQVALKRYRAPGSPHTHDLRFTYRADGQLGRVTYPDGGGGALSLQYSYDERGKVVQVPSLITAIQHDLAGRQTRVNFANGVEQTYEYDQASGRLTAMVLSGAAGVIRATSYVHDRVGNLLRVDSPDPKLATSHRYDDLYRLTDASSDAGDSWSFRYDDVGNLTFKSDVGDYRYGERGAAATCLTTAGSQTFTYTMRGEMKATPWGTQTFDPQGRLIRIARPDGTQTDFAYDHAGRRVSERSSSGVSPAIERLTPDAFYSIEQGALVLNLFDGHGMAARRVVGGGTLFLHPDHLGGLAVVTNSNGQVVETLRHDPYGRLLERTGQEPALPVGFIGATVDAASGLLYLSARYYHPGLGRFVSPDSVIQHAYDPAAWSAFGYCRGNPVSYADPSGHGFWSVFLSAIALGALYVALSVATLGAATPLLTPIVLLVGGGMITGGLVGGLAASRAGGEFGEIFAGVFVGAAVGGWAAFGGVYGGAAVAGAAKGGVWGFFANIGGGALSGAINGSAIGFAAGFAGGRGSDDVWKSVWQAAAVGLLTGGITGIFGWARAAKAFGPPEKPLYLNADFSAPKWEKAAGLFAAGAGARLLTMVLTKEELSWDTLGQATLIGLTTAGWGAALNIGSERDVSADKTTWYKFSWRLPEILAPQHLGATSGVFASVSAAAFALQTGATPGHGAQGIISGKGY